MKLVLLNTNGVYSHKIQYDGIKNALNEIKNCNNDFDFVEKNISQQDDGEIQKYNPDYIFCITPLASGYRVWKKRGIKVIVFETEGLYECKNTIDNISYCDIFSTVDRKAVEYFKNNSDRNKSCRFYHMPLGFCPSVYKFQDAPEEYKSDICFAGAIFDLRRKVIEQLYPLRDKIKTRIITPKDWAGRVIHQNDITFFQKDFVPVSEMVKYYCGAKIILCVNRDYDPANNSGLLSTTPGRVFQEAACRRMVMLDNTRPEIHDYFVDGKEIVLFDSDNGEDLRQKVMYYLEHNEEREAIAHNGCQRTMAENTWKHRIQGLLNFVRQ